MTRLIVIGVLGLGVLGCTQQHRYQIDFRDAPEFRWNGTLLVTKSEHMRLFDWFGQGPEWTVDRVDLGGEGGRVATIDLRGYRDAPMAMVQPADGCGLWILGTREVWSSRMRPDRWVASPADADGTSKPAPATSPPSDQPSGQAGKPESPPAGQTADKLSPAEWGAIARQATEVTVEYPVPDKQVRVVLRGKPGADDPSVMEVWSLDGRLLQRFERKQIPVTTLPAGDAAASSQPAAASP